MVSLDAAPPKVLQPSSFEFRAFRKGLIGLTSFGSENRCPEADGLGPSCSCAWFAAFSGSMVDGAGWAGVHQAGDITGWRMVPGVNTRGHAYAGRDAVLVVSDHGSAIETIDDRGAQVFRIPGSSGLLGIVHLVETSQGRALLGLTATRLRGQEVEVLAVYPLDLHNGEAALGKPSVLPFSPARSIGEGKFLRSVGLLSAIRLTPSPSVTASGELSPTWSLTWIEAVVPTSMTPETEDSSPLDSPQIAQRQHVARLDRQGSIKGDRVTIVPRAAQEQAAASITQPTLTGRAIQWPKRLSFDSAQATGEVIYAEEGALLVVRFDERGQPLGPPSPAPADVLHAPEPEKVPWPPVGQSGIPTLAPGCLSGVQVRPGLAVLLCDEPSGARMPGRLGLRRYRYGPI